MKQPNPLPLGHRTKCSYSPTSAGSGQKTEWPPRFSSPVENDPVLSECGLQSTVGTPRMGEKVVRRQQEGKEGSQKWELYQKFQSNLPNLELYLFFKKCKQYSLFDLVQLQNGWQWFQGPGEFDGKLLKLTNGSLQMNAEDLLPLGKSRAHFQMERKHRWEGEVVLRLTFALLAGKQLTGSF